MYAAPVADFVAFLVAGTMLMRETRWLKKAALRSNGG